MVINAAYGQAIKAVYSGTVVFSDYLRGYGLVILDHGKGDMTLYGLTKVYSKKKAIKSLLEKPLRLPETLVVSQKPHFFNQTQRKAQDPRAWLAR